MIIKPRVRGFLCITTHPVGCEANVKNQIDYVKAQGPIENGPFIINAQCKDGILTFCRNVIPP